MVGIGSSITLAGPKGPWGRSKPKPAVQLDLIGQRLISSEATRAVGSAEAEAEEQMGP